MGDASPCDALVEASALDRADLGMGGVPAARALVTSDVIRTRVHAEDDVFLLAHDMSEDAPEHGHGFYELCYAYRGRLVNRIGGEELFMPEGSLCVMNLRSRHSLSSADSASVVVNVCLKPRLFSAGVFADWLASDGVVPAFMRGEGGRERIFLLDPGKEALGHTIRALLFEYADAGFRQDFRVAARVLLLLSQAERVQAHSFHGINDRMMQVIDYIGANYATASCATIAHDLGFSENYLSQFVRRHTGSRLSQIIRDVRLERASELLRTTDLPVTEVARRVGYESYSHFHRIYCARYGRTPARARDFGRGRSS